MGMKLHPQVEFHEFRTHASQHRRQQTPANHLPRRCGGRCTLNRNFDGFAHTPRGNMLRRCYFETMTANCTSHRPM